MGIQLGASPVVKEAIELSRTLRCREHGQHMLVRSGPTEALPSTHFERLQLATCADSFRAPFAVTLEASPREP